MLRIRTTLMRIQIRLFTSLRIRVRLSLRWGSESGFFLRIRILIIVMQICYTGLQTLHGHHGSDVSASKAAGFSLWSGSGFALPKLSGSRSANWFEELVWKVPGRLLSLSLFIDDDLGLDSTKYEYVQYFILIKSSLLRRENYTNVLFAAVYQSVRALYNNMTKLFFSSSEIRERIHRLGSQGNPSFVIHDIGSQCSKS